MKLGRNLPKVRRALHRAARLGCAMYVERGTMADAVVMRLADKPDDGAPYFAMVLVAGWECRPSLSLQARDGTSPGQGEAR
jgi:precorrin-2/cobalt-factor-2 C20-methyltransferase